MTQIIVNFLNWLSGIVTSFIPAFTIDSAAMSGLSSALSHFKTFIANVNWLVPVNDCLLIISVLVGIQIAKMVVFVVNWIIRRIADIIP